MAGFKPYIPIDKVGYSGSRNIVYDDLQVSIARVSFPGVADPTWRRYNHGIGGGVDFDVLGFALNDFVNIDIQTTHAMKLSSVIDNHIHFLTPTDGTGKKIKFQLDVIAAPINGNWAVPSGSPFTSELSMDEDMSNKHKLLELADIPALNTTVSTIYTLKLMRIAASADEYAGEVYLKFNDSHIKKDTLGSLQEDSKV